MAKIKNYDKIMEYIYNSPKGTALGLYSIGKILGNMGNPEKKLKIIHVGGTNGKGSTCTFIAEILQEMGYKVGLYTSPFLEEFNERIQINKKNISNDELASVVGKTKVAVDRYIAEGNPVPTEFEIITAAAYQYFYEEQVDFVVLEVGLGGALDATNTCDPILSVITSISVDHIEYLGDDLLEIARTKAGIIKDGKKNVLYRQDEEVEKVILDYAKSIGASVIITETDKIKIKSTDRNGQVFDAEVFGECFSDIRISMAGEHQIKNFLTALTAIKTLERDQQIKPLCDDILKKAALKAKWRGRLELIVQDPITILDGAHNVGGASALAEYIKNNLSELSLMLVFGMLKDKDIKGTLKILSPFAKEFVITIPDSPRAASIQEIEEIVRRYSSLGSTISSFEKIEDAVEYAQDRASNQKNSAVIYAGSLYMIGTVRSLLRKRYHIEY